MSFLGAVIDGVLLGGYYAMVACGLSFMFGIMKIINLAHAAVLAVGALLAYTLFTRLGANLAVALLGAVCLAREQAKDAIRVAHRRDFRVHYDNRAVGKVHRKMRALLDTRRRVADHVVKAVSGEIVEHTTHTVRRERVLIACL